MRVTDSPLIWWEVWIGEVCNESVCQASRWVSKHGSLTTQSSDDNEYPDGSESRLGY